MKGITKFSNSTELSSPVVNDAEYAYHGRRFAQDAAVSWRMLIGGG